MTVENADKMIVVYNRDDIMAIVPLDEIKTVVFADCGSADEVNALVEAISVTFA